MKLKRAALAVGLSSLLAGLAFPAFAQDAGWDSVVAAAKKEGKVVVYSMALGAPYYVAVLKSFEAKYGIKVESLDLRASELAERVRTEQAAGRFLGDTEIITTTMIEEQRKTGDYIQAVGTIPNVKNLRAPFKATEVSVPAYVQPMGILVNTRLVKPEDEPKSWEDLNKAGVRIAVPQASSMDRFVTEHTPKADIQRFPDNAAAIAAFQSGRVEAVCLFHPPLLAARQRLGKGKIVVPTPAVTQASSTALRKGDTEFVAWVDKQLAEYYKSGQTQKWYEAALKDFGLDPSLAPPIMKEMIK